MKAFWSPSEVVEPMINVIYSGCDNLLVVGRSLQAKPKSPQVRNPRIIMIQGHQQ